MYDKDPIYLFRVNILINLFQTKLIQQQRDPNENNKFMKILLRLIFYNIPHEFAERL